MLAKEDYTYWGATRDRRVVRAACSNQKSDVKEERLSWASWTAEAKAVEANQRGRENREGQ